MGKLNPEEFSLRLQDMNKYLDFIPIGKSTGAVKTQKAYGQALPYDEADNCEVGWKNVR
jgi:hypothetical protein